jgi:tetratricopeptide (TPR) repeat protein
VLRCRYAPAGKLAVIWKEMNFIKEIIWAIKSGSYSGKGNKCTRKGDFQKALYYYKKALKYSSDNSGSGAIFLECIARCYARLEEYEKSLFEAEKCLDMLNTIDSSARPIKDARIRIENLIYAIKNNDMKSIKEMVAI